MTLENVKSQRRKPKLKHECFCTAYYAKKMDWKRGDATKDSAKPLQQRFWAKKTLARTGYEALGAFEGLRNDEREGHKLQREKLYKMQQKQLRWVCSGTAKIQEFDQIHWKTTWVVK